MPAHLFRPHVRELALLSRTYLSESQLHPALITYPTLVSLMEPLVQQPSRAPQERRSLIASVIAVHQTRPHALWSTALRHVFARMLRKLRKVLQGADEDTRDAILLEKFLEVLARVPTDDPPRIFMHVRRELRRAVFGALAEIAAWEEIGFGSDADLEPDPATLKGPSLFGIWLKGFGARPDQNELLATVVDHGGLRALVARRHAADAPADRARAYRTLHKKRARLMNALRRHLAGC